MHPSMRHVLMTLLDRVDDFIKLGSSIAQKLLVSLISINVRSEGGSGGKDQRSSHEIIGCDFRGTDTRSVDTGVDKGEFCDYRSSFVTEGAGHADGDDGGDNGNVSTTPNLPSAS